MFFIFIINNNKPRSGAVNVARSLHWQTCATRLLMVAGLQSASASVTSTMPQYFIIRHLAS